MAIVFPFVGGPLCLSVFSFPKVVLNVGFLWSALECSHMSCVGCIYYNVYYIVRTK
jgi:hypothetical protein